MTEPSPTPPPAVVVRAGEVVGSYRLERRIGAGGMGEVWLARHVRSNGVAAVKLVAGQHTRRGDAKALFARERMAVARLSHPHIVPVFELGTEHIAMQFVDGTSVARRLRAGLAPSTALRIARQIASALAQAHGRGVVHLDVKPANILLDAGGNAFLTDFGAAMLLEERGARPPIAGTPEYMAPERGAGGRVGPAADQFSLGLTLASMLLGEEPSDGDPDGKTRETDRLHGERDVAAIVARLPSSVRSVVARCLAQDPSTRFKNMKALEEALEGCDVQGLEATVARCPFVRDVAPFAWADAPSETSSPAPDIVQADYTLDALEATGSIAASDVARFRCATGLRSTGFTLYAHARSLGAAPSAAWLARARHIVVLAAGYAMTRDAWNDVALAVVRDDPEAIVAAIDIHGFGDAHFADDLPASEHLGYTAAGRTILAWTDLVHVSAMPTVFLAHSMSATGLLLAGDEAIGPHRARVLLTPMLNPLRAPRLPAVRRVGLAFVALLFRLRLLYWFFLAATAHLSHSLRDLTRARRRALVEQSMRLSSKASARVVSVMLDERLASREPVHRTYFALGEGDPEASPELVAQAERQFGLRIDRVRWLASGAHHPHIDNQRDPEGTKRNRHEIGRLVDEALDEVSPMRHGSPDLAHTELAPRAPMTA